MIIIIADEHRAIKIEITNGSSNDEKKDKPEEEKRRKLNAKAHWNSDDVDRDLICC